MTTDNNNPAPEPQDTPPKKLYGGKYETVEEMESAYEESVRSQSQLGEENDRMQRYISLMDQPAAPASAPNDPEYTDGNGEELPQGYRDYVDNQLDARENRIRKNAEVEDQFFKLNPDLAQHKKLVLLHTIELRNESAGKTMSLPKVMEEVGKRVREHVESIKGGKAPPHVGGGSRGERPSVGAPKTPETDEQRLTDYISENRQRKNKQLTKG